MEELGDERLGLGGEPSDAIVRTRQSLHDLGSLRAGVRALVREELDELVELVHRHVERRGEDARRSHGGMVERAETWISRRASRAARCGGGGGIFCRRRRADRKRRRTAVSSGFPDGCQLSRTAG